MLVAVDLRVKDLNLVLGSIRKHLLQGWVGFQSVYKKNLRVGLTGEDQKRSRKDGKKILHGLLERWCSASFNAIKSQSE